MTLDSRPLEQLCPHCGGSGILRLGDKRARTCLDCLGTGRIHLEEPVGATTAPALIAFAKPSPAALVSGSTSSSAA